MHVVSNFLSLCYCRSCSCPHSEIGTTSNVFLAGADLTRFLSAWLEVESMGLKVGQWRCPFWNGKFRPE